MAEPVWKQPGWITAIVGMVSILLTIPQIVGDYLAKQQDIKLAEQKADAIRLKNIDLQQDQEFKIVLNTLAQQGSERIFVLRYLAATLDDISAKKWAQDEVKYLNDLVSLKEKVKIAEEALQQKQTELNKIAAEGSSEKEKLKNEILLLKSDLSSKNAEVSQQQEKAGFRSNFSSPSPLMATVVYHIELIGDKGESLVGRKLSMTYSDGRNDTYVCLGNNCEFTIKENLPVRIDIAPAEGVKGVSGTAFIPSAVLETPFFYRCDDYAKTEKMVCDLIDREQLENWIQSISRRFLPISNTNLDIGWRTPFQQQVDKDINPVGK